MDIRPDHANLMKNGDIVKVDPDEVMVGDNIVIMPGDRIPLDAMVVEGMSMVDTSAITGESLPRDVGPGQRY